MKKYQKMLPYFISSIAIIGLSFLPHSVSAQTDATANVKASIDETLSIALSNNNLVFNMDDNLLKTQSLTVTGKTNNASGYTISFNVNNDYTELRHSNTAVNASIPTLETDALEATFPNTAWGYTADTEIFKAIPENPTNIFTTTLKGENNHTFITGIKVNSDMPAGDYENELIFTAIANPKPIVTFDIAFELNNIPKTHVDNDNPTGIEAQTGDYYTMQDITSKICNIVDNEEATRLLDTRDNKLYWVSKLKDGRCWMTQNLDLDLKTTKTLTPNDTDITEPWTPASNTNPFDINKAWANMNVINSVDFGDYYQYAVLNHYEICDANSETYSQCVDDVLEGSIETRTDIYQTTPADFNKEHGHLGNGYNWAAALARNNISDLNGSIVVRENVKNSICPKGWRLPLGNRNSYDTEKNDFAILMKAYFGVETTDAVILDDYEGFIKEPFYFAFPVNEGTTGHTAKYITAFNNSTSWYTAAYLDGNRFLSVVDGAKGTLYNIRCIAR